MRMYFVVFTCLCAALMWSVSQQYLQSKFNLQSPKDYRAFMTAKPAPGDVQKHPLYEVAAAILGYKPVMLLDPVIVTMMKENASDMLQALIDAKPYYACIEGMGGDYILYSDNTRKEALLLIEAFIGDTSFYGEEYMWYHYIMGRLLGYPTEDIKLFVQHRTFGIEKNKDPESQSELQQFIQSRWKNYYEKQYQEIARQVNRYIQKSSIDNIEQRIQEISTRKDILVIYDRPSSELMDGNVCKVLMNMYRLFQYVDMLYQRGVRVHGNH